MGQLLSGRKKKGWSKSAAGGIGTNSSSENLREELRLPSGSLRNISKVLSKASHKWTISSGFPPRAALPQFTEER